MLSRARFYSVALGARPCGVSHDICTSGVGHGKLTSVKKVFLRTLSLHLQICWQMVPGRKFFLSSHAAGWSIPIAFLAVELSVTGVSFRFGDSCHINSKNDLQTFWGPLLAVAAACIVTQSITSVPDQTLPVRVSQVLTLADSDTASKSTSAVCLKRSRQRLAEVRSCPMPVACAPSQQPRHYGACNASWPFNGEA